MASIFSTLKALTIHAWKGFLRSHHFERSLGTKALLAFVAFTMIWYLFYLAVMLPGLLKQLFPDKSTTDAFFSLLLFIYTGDFIFRYFMQKVPRQQVQAYLHLPVKRHHLTRVMMLRSWFSVYNFYLLALLIPFFFFTLHQRGYTLEFWLAIAGCMLLGGINHAFIIWLKTNNQKTFSAIILIILVIIAAISGLFFREQLYLFSENMGNAFIRGKVLAFLTPLAMIAFLQSATGKALRQSLYAIHNESPGVKVSDRGGLEKLFNKFPSYGHFWELEWKLLNRNKRASRGFRQWPLMLIFIPFFLYSGREDLLHTYMFFFIMFAGSYGFFHLQYVYSWESRFFDFIAARKLKLYDLIKSKYYFYTILAIIQTVLLLPMLYFIRPTLMLPLVGMMLYVTGPVFAYLFYMGISYSTRIDPNKKAFFNLEGTSGTQFIMIFSIMLSYFPFLIVAFALPLNFEVSISLVFGITGLGFWGMHRLWIKKVVRKFERRKYIQLNKYREK